MEIACWADAVEKDKQSNTATALKNPLFIECFSTRPKREDYFCNRQRTISFWIFA
ncbi:hypothetical protein NY78_0163 [Desulfovibrio sp. TomC]|nr:hypothetical protein NY78_0163 [Desulfovibrio sp. TomC]